MEHSTLPITLTIPLETSESPPSVERASVISEKEGVNWYLSPSLSTAKAQAGAYEIKQRIGYSQAERVLSWARQHLILDPHIDPALRNAYRVLTIYFDTEQIDVYRQTPAYAYCKFRLRRYGGDDKVYLERKDKREGQVRKQRTRIAASELDRLCEFAHGSEWAGDWFRQQVQELHLAPSCLIRYDRVAYVSSGENGPVRLTLDRNLYCWQTGYYFEEAGPRRQFLEDEMILEIKFHTALPALFQAMLTSMEIRPDDVSKYRCGVEALGMAQTAWGLSSISAKTANSLSRP
ncbi:MAG: polyphosphate polymerase domain-containing protein [Armatimonadetes bacterium]|nr:polyphosphate polymerase domain-containing protein [Armatimonadota bacterium]